MTQRTLSFLFTAAIAASLSAPWSLAAPMAQAQGQGQADASSADHVVVPLSHPGQPATLRVSVVTGSITVKTASGNNVVIDTDESSDSSSRRRARPEPPEAQGMHRLNTSAGISAEEDNNVVTVRNSVFGGGNLVIQVPANTSVSLRAVNGGKVEVDGLTGDISAEDTNGNVILNNVSGSIVASATNGRIFATITRLDPSKPSSFSSLNGTIDVTLPPDVKANLRLKSDHGDIYLDDGFNFQATRTPSSATGSRDSDGMYKVRMDRSVSGTLNGGGSEIRVQNFNGNIYLRKGK
ncbi:MAG TPA: DUF4097 family beta strand repeat-containing protein [Terriglobales bacterium]|nr:DUF4097 family beta strand repeat-containing protein [Terriglobales bacterium]